MSRPKKKKVKSKKPKPKSEGKDIIPTNTDIILVSLHGLMEGDEHLKKIPKPTRDFVEHWLKVQPTLKGMAFIEKREHFMNLIVLAWLRNMLWSDIAKEVDAHPETWREHVETKEIRAITKIIEIQEKVMPPIFKELGKKFDEREVTKKIIQTIREEKIEFEIQIEPDKKKKGEIIDGSYEVIDDETSKPGG